MFTGVPRPSLEAHSFEKTNRFQTAGWSSKLQEMVGRTVKRFLGGLVFKAHRLVYHSTLGWRAITKKRSLVVDELVEARVQLI